MDQHAITEEAKVSPINNGNKHHQKVTAVILFSFFLFNAAAVNKTWKYLHQQRNDDHQHQQHHHPHQHNNNNNNNNWKVALSQQSEKY